MPLLRQDEEPGHVDWNLLQWHIYGLPHAVPVRGHDQRWYPVGQHHLVAKGYNGHILPIHRDWRLSNRLP